MSINNPTAADFDVSALGDISAFEPEAILNALPGEHPRLARGLQIGREASQSGALDVGALSEIANEFYAEGFPAGSPFASSPQIPENDSLTYIASKSVLPKVESPLQVNSPSNVSEAYAVAYTVPGHSHAKPNLATAEALQLQHAPAFNADALQGLAPSAYNLDISQLLGGAEVPFQTELNELLAGSSLSQYAASTTNNSAHESPFYFVQDNALSVSPYNQLAPAGFTSAHPAFDVQSIRKDFPILSETVNGHPLVWFDNAATTQKPQVVIDRVSYFYQHENSNIHRAAHEIAARATDAYEEARETVRRFINAPSVNQVIFVRGTTEGINLVAKTWGKKHLSAGDEIVISHLEHHANIVPWQQLCKETGAVLKVAPVDDSGQILLNEYQQLLTTKVKLVSFTQVSNALGTVTPASQMIQMAHRVGAKVLLDGAQSVSHMPTDVQALDADFFVFSGHKVFGPTGIGVVYGKADVLDDMPPWQGGGNMIQDVTFEKTVYHDAPAKFEAGTGNIADAVGLGAALQYVERIGIHNIARYEHALLEYATAKMAPIPGVRLIGTAADKASVLSFSLKGYASEEVGAALNAKGIAVRSGHHCAQPILRRFGVETTVRPSFAFYNTFAEIDALVAVIRGLVK